MCTVDNGATRVASTLASAVPSFLFELGEGLDKLGDLRNLRFWQYEHFVKIRGHLFLGKIDA